MTTYKGIRGQTIRTVAGDASPLIAGDIWYSNTTRKIRGAKLVAAWATGGTMNAGRWGGAAAGIQTAAVTMCGDPGPPGDYGTQCETYNGAAWTAENAANTGRRYAHCGGGASAPTGMIMGGASAAPNFEIATVNTEIFDGTSWTEVGNLNVAGLTAGGLTQGTSTAMLNFGGGTGNHPNPKVATNELWNGTAWTEVGDLGASRYSHVGLGTSTAALGVAGNAPGVVATVVSWNGTSWSNDPASINDSRTELSGAGSQTAGLIFGGSSPGVTANTEEYDGSTWAEVNNLNTATKLSGGAGTSTLALSVGGTPNGSLAPTGSEEWTAAVTASSFTSS
jgi:hypothetical protein